MDPSLFTTTSTPTTPSSSTQPKRHGSRSRSWPQHPCLRVHAHARLLDPGALARHYLGRLHLGRAFHCHHRYFGPSTTIGPRWRRFPKGRQHDIPQHSRLSLVKATLDTMACSRLGIPPWPFHRRPRIPVRLGRRPPRGLLAPRHFCQGYGQHGCILVCLGQPHPAAVGVCGICSGFWSNASTGLCRLLLRCSCRGAFRFLRFGAPRFYVSCHGNGEY